ncbi:hypothetical protein AVEN_19301-1 [Araneus ventricosus]|uniref:Uncharacterized protein n=1 Tax=Araneus ventricosus TaxID=182803 RepID=A0A4Y2MUY0_ARAVE|nr:hypothetical protein AVEN_19301-1 [Araneus ventricosus]
MAEMLISNAVNNADPPGLTWGQLGDALGFDAQMPSYYKKKAWSMIANQKIYKLGQVIYPSGPVKQSELELLKYTHLTNTIRDSLLDYIGQHKTVSYSNICDKFKNDADRKTLEVELRNLLNERRLKLDKNASFQRVYSPGEHRY